MRTIKNREDIFIEFDDFNELKELFEEVIKIIENKSK